MAAISATDIDRALVTFCYEVGERKTPFGCLRYERILPWAFVQFPDSGDPRYVSPLTGQQSVGLHAQGGAPYFFGSEYMRTSAFPHEQDYGSTSPPDGDVAKPGPRAVHFFGTGGV